MEEVLVDKNNLSQAEKNRSCNIFLIILLLAFLFLSIIFIILYAIEKNKKKEKKTNPDNYNPLSLWEDCDSKNKILDYIKEITSEKSVNFIPKSDRIAVFDMDGTIFQETDPTYCDLKLFVYRVLNDTNYTATDDQIDLAYQILNNTMSYNDGGRSDRIYAEIYKDMTIEDLFKYIKNFLNQDSDGYIGMKRGDAFYKPMLELIEYLQKNDFIIYIVTATERFTSRAIIEGHLNIPTSHIIGTETKIVANNQNSTDSVDYIFQKNDILIFNGTFISKNSNLNKVLYILKEIGKVPILSFGNSNSDSSMANFVVGAKNYKRMAFMVLCDDTVRENGNIDKAKSMEKSCEDNDWVPISMKNDWKTIYGDNVKRKDINSEI